MASYGTLLEDNCEGPLDGEPRAQLSRFLDKCCNFIFLKKLEAPSQPQHFSEFMTAVLSAEPKAISVS